MYNNNNNNLCVIFVRYQRLCAIVGLLSLHFRLFPTVGLYSALNLLHLAERYHVFVKLELPND